ncbi:hypothetical protein [Streptomyces sp. NPDC056352]
MTMFWGQGGIALVSVPAGGRDAELGGCFVTVEQVLVSVVLRECRQLSDIEETVERLEYRERSTTRRP